MIDRVNGPLFVGFLRMPRFSIHTLSPQSLFVALNAYLKSRHNEIGQNVYAYIDSDNKKIDVYKKIVSSHLVHFDNGYSDH